KYPAGFALFIFQRAGESVLAVSSARAAKIVKGAPDSSRKLGKRAAKTALSLANSRATLCPSPAPESVRTRKCGLFTSIHGFSPAQAWPATAITPSSRDTSLHFILERNTPRTNLDAPPAS